MPADIKDDMKLKAKIVGPKVQDVGYRYFLMSMAMSNRIRMFEAHNIESNEVWAFVDGDDEAVKAFRAQAETKRPAKAGRGVWFSRHRAAASGGVRGGRIPKIVGRKMPGGCLRRILGSANSSG